MGWQGVLNKKKFARIDEVFDELCSVTGDLQESLKKTQKSIISIDREKKSKIRKKVKFFILIIYQTKKKVYKNWLSP